MMHWKGAMAAIIVGTRDLRRMRSRRRNARGEYGCRLGHGRECRVRHGPVLRRRNDL